MTSPGWRSYCVEGLRHAEPSRRIAAMDRIHAGYAAVDDEIERLLLDALDDAGVWTFEERDWDDFDDEFGRRMCTRTRGVAEEAVKILGAPKRRARSVAAIEARIADRAPEASATLYRALGELGPESTETLLRAGLHPSERVRSAARAALVRASSWSTAAQKLAIVGRAIDGIGNPAEAGDWLAFLEHAHGLFSPHQRAMREYLRTAGPSYEVVERWLASDVRSVRAVANSILAHRALDARARGILAARIARDLPGQRNAEPERDQWRHRRLTEIELAIHVLAVEVPEALASIRREDARARAALRDYAVRELGRPDPGTADGAPWFVAHELAKRIADEDAVAEALAQMERANGGG